MKKKFCLVIANYYPKISNNLIKGSSKILRLNGYKNIKKVYAPGVFEIPVIISKLIKKYDAFVALGCVIKGETPHFDLICKTSFDAIITLSINYNKPISNGIITALNKKQAYKRCGIINSNKPNKGLEAANALLAILENGPKKI